MSGLEISGIRSDLPGHTVEVVDEEVCAPRLKCLLFAQWDEAPDIFRRLIPVYALNLLPLGLKKPTHRYVNTLAFLRTLLVESIRQQPEIGYRFSRDIPDEIVPVTPLDVSEA